MSKYSFKLGLMGCKQSGFHTAHKPSRSIPSPFLFPFLSVDCSYLLWDITHTLLLMWTNTDGEMCADSIGFFVPTLLLLFNDALTEFRCLSKHQTHLLIGFHFLGIKHLHVPESDFVPLLCMIQELKKTSFNLCCFFVFHSDKETLDLSQSWGEKNWKIGTRSRLQCQFFWTLEIWAACSLPNWPINHWENMKPGDYHSLTSFNVSLDGVMEGCWVGLCCKEKRGSLSYKSGYDRQHINWP